MIFESWIENGYLGFKYKIKALKLLSKKVYNRIKNVSNRLILHEKVLN